MKRDMKLITEILRYAEGHADGGKSQCVPQRDSLAPNFDDLTDAKIHYHINLCVEAGFLEVEESNDVVPDTCIPWCRILNLTWQGHDFLDNPSHNKKARPQTALKKLGIR